MKKCVAFMVLLTIVLLIGSVLAGPMPLMADGNDTASIRVVNSDLSGTRFDVNVPGVGIVERSENRMIYSVLDIPGAGVLNEPGYPELPVIRRRVAVPHGAEVDVTVNVITSQTVQNVQVWPAQPQYKRTEAKPPFLLNTRIYQTNRFYPGHLVTVSDEIRMRDLRSVMITLCPVQYNPVTGEMTVATEIEVEVVTTGGTEFVSEPVFPSFHRVYCDNTVNARYLDLEMRTDPEPLLIITDDGFVSDLSSFAEWKTKRGLDVTIAPISVTGAGSAAIRAYIEDAYANWNPKPVYILLVGDYAQVEPMYSSSYGTSSDYLFTNLEGSDLAPDVFVSRLSAQNTTELSVQLEKIIHYETLPADDIWLNHAAGLSSSLGSSPSDDDYSDGILTRWEAINPDINAERLYVSNGQGTSANISAAVNEGVFWVNYVGHGSGTSWSDPPFTNSNVDALTNGYFTPFVMDVSCLNGGFGGSGDCFAERWMKGGTVGNPRGAVAIYSSYTSTSWDPPAVMSWGVCYSVAGDGSSIPGGNIKMGAMTYDGMMYLEQEFGSGSDTEEVLHQYILFGDCSAFMRYDALVDPVVTHLPTLPMAPVDFEVSVNDARGPIEGAFVCAYKPGDVHQVVETGSDGVAILNLHPSTIGDLIITVSGPNIDPYEAIVSVAPAGCGIVVLDRNTYNCDDLITIGVIDADLNTNPGVVETTEVTINSGSEPAGEMILCTETGPDSGQFEGSVMTSETQAGQGYLLLTHGDTIEVHYYDTDCDGSPADVYDNADADCHGPVISNVSVSGITGDSAVVTWTTDEPADSMVTWGESTPPATVISDPGMTLNHEIILSDLSACMWHYFEVSGIDSGGNVASDDNGGIYYSFQTWELTEFLADDMESGSGSWTATGLWNMVDAGSSCSEYHSADHAWYYGQEASCDYDTGATTAGTLTSGIIDLTETTAAELHVWYWHQCEGTVGYDTFSINIQVVGSGLTTLLELESSTSGWQEFVADLNEYIGNEIQLVFEFNSGDSISNDYRGSYIDDVSIIATGPCSDPTPTPTPNECLHTGDATLDGEVTSADAQLTFQIALGVVQPTDEEACAADCNGDGEVTSADAQGVFICALGAGSCSDDMPASKSLKTGYAHFKNRITAVEPADNIWLETEIDHRDQSLIVNVMVSSETQAIDAITLSIAFDADTLLPEECVTGSLDPDWIDFGCFEIEPGRINVAAFNAGISELSPEISVGSYGSLASLKFRTLSPKPDLQSLEIIRLADDLESFVY